MRFMASLSDQIRAALAKAHEPAVEIAQATGVHPVNLSQFKAGRRDLPLKNLEAIADHLGLEIVLRSKSATSGKSTE